MTRQLVSWGLALGLAALLPAYRASADELPIRKAGLWEMKMATVGSPVAESVVDGDCGDRPTCGCRPGLSGDRKSVV